MDGLGARGARGRDDLVLAEVTLGGGRGADRHRLVGLEHVQGLAVGLGEDGDGRDAHLAAGANDAHRDLTAIGDQDLREGGRHDGGDDSRPAGTRQ